MVQAALQDYSSAASSYFGDARTPASIVMGYSIASIFALPGFSTKEHRQSIELFLVRTYRILSWLAFILSLHVFIIASIANTNVLLIKSYNPLAESAMEMMNREFQYEFLIVLWSMTVSILLTVVVVTIRVLLQFDLLKREERLDTGRFVICSSAALMASLLNYLCQRDEGLSLTEMTTTLAKLIVRDLTESTPVAMEIFAMGFAALSIFFAVRSSLFNPERVKIE